MKKLSLFLLLALFIIVACKNEGEPPQQGPDSAVSNYLTVSLVTPKSAVGRAGEKYEDGKAEENHINSVRFFFFDGEGNPSKVSKQAATNTYRSYIDWIPTSTDQSQGPVSGETVEKIVTATLGINMPVTEELPKLVVAVLNPSSDVLSLAGNPSLQQLRSQVYNYYDGLTDSNFVITNSVYAENGKSVDATPIDGNFRETADSAALHPLYIYVERVLARLDLSLGLESSASLSSGEFIYKVSEKPYMVDGAEKDIYVKFLGWNVTATTTASRLIKLISPQWPSTLFADLEPWNISEFHRSFWGINPQEGQFTYQYGTYDGIADGQLDPNAGNYATALTIPAPGKSETVYLQENVAEYNQEQNGEGPAVPSKVILAAQLVDINGNPLTLAHWANRYYTYNGALASMANSLNLYQKETSEGSTTYTQISPKYLQFVSANEIYPDGLPDDVASYYVYAQLNDTAKVITWYNGNAESAAPYTTEEANAYILNRVNYAMVWNTGYSYYYFDIRHLGAKGNPGYFGVVRNHLYLAKVSSLTGLGTPVFKPNQVIYPEMPGYDDNVITAVIRILQWRVVSQEYPLVWP
ncbi:MAG: Mfa1 family fimbria major subunit [Muribaculaceae bacterium]|nr:Mfa1 family fimbria major subunit [Muribaculaceae bacterium]